VPQNRELAPNVCGRYVQHSQCVECVAVDRALEGAAGGREAGSQLVQCPGAPNRGSSCTESAWLGCPGRAGPRSQACIGRLDLDAQALVWRRGTADETRMGPRGGVRDLRSQDLVAISRRTAGRHRAERGSGSAKRALDDHAAGATIRRGPGEGPGQGSACEPTYSRRSLAARKRSNQIARRSSFRTTIAASRREQAAAPAHVA
jgi:hypothetical protein